MNKETAINILINAVQIGQKSGAYNLMDAKVIAEAVQFLVPAPTRTPDIEKVEAEVVEEETK